MVRRKEEGEKYSRWKEQHVQMPGEETVLEPLRELKAVKCGMPGDGKMMGCWRGTEEQANEGICKPR